MNFGLTINLVCMAFLIGSSNAYRCCDSLNIAADSNDCTCSDLTGALGTCSCTSSPNSRAGIPCIKISTFDSVNMSLNKDFLTTFHALIFFLSVNVVWKVEAAIEDVEITLRIYVGHLVQILRVLERVNIKGAAQTMIRLYVFFFKFLTKKNHMCIMTAFESTLS